MTAWWRQLSFGLTVAHYSSQGIDEYQEEPIEKGPHYNQDPTGRRTGNACDTNVQKVSNRHSLWRYLEHE